MASIKVKYRPSTVADKEGVICYQIIHNRTPRQITTHYHIKPDEWDNKRSTVVSADKSRETFIACIRYRIRCDIERLNRIIARFAGTLIDFTSNDVAEEFQRYSKEYSFSNYMERIIARLLKNGKTGTAENYRSALNSFRKFLVCQVPVFEKIKDDDIMLDNISPDLMERYEAWQRSLGNILVDDKN